MKIYDLNLTGGAAAAGTGRTQESQRSSQAAGSQTGATAGAGDRVEFSSTLGRLSMALSAHDSARANRIQALAQQYQSGTHRPDAAATARGMVSEAMAASSH